MLQSMSDKVKGWGAGIIILFIAVSFVLFGVERFFEGGGDNGSAAIVVGSQKIPEQVIDDNLMQLQQNPQYSSVPVSQLKEMVIQRLIANAIVVQSAQDLGLVVTQDQVNADIMSNKSFMDDGKFSMDLLQRTLMSYGMSVAAYQDMLRSGMLQNQMASVFSLGFVPDSFVQTVANLDNQTRDIAYVTLSPADFMNSIPDPKEKDILAYYVTHKGEFVQPEMVKIDYVLVSPDDIKNQVKITDAMMQQYYNDNLSTYTVPAKWQIISISAPFNGDLSGKSYQVAKSSLDQIHKALIAKNKISEQDLTQQAQKNNLKVSQMSWLSEGSNAPELPMLSKLKTGDVSIPFVNGNHLEMVYVVNLQPSKQKSFTEAKEIIYKSLLMQQSEKKLSQISDKLSDLAYANPDNLQVVAKAVGGSVKTSDWLSKENNATKSLLTDDKVLQAAFSADVLQNGNNSNVINLENGSLIVLRVANTQSAQTLSLASVKDEILKNIKLATAKNNMQNFVLSLQRNIATGNMSKDLLNSKSLVWKVVNGLAVDSGQVPPAISVQSFLMRPSAAPAKSIAEVAMADGKTAILVLSAVHQATKTVNADKFLQVRADLVQQNATNLLALYYNHKKMTTRVRK